MILRKSIDSILEVLGLIGFTVRSDRKKNAWKNLDNRIWGTPTAGFALSLQLRPAIASKGESVKAVVAIRNDKGQDVRENIQGWIKYFTISIVNPHGALIEPSSFGRRVLAGGSEAQTVAIFPTAAPVQRELPLSDLYDLRQAGVYRITVACPVPETGGGIHCESNTSELIRR